MDTSTCSTSPLTAPYLEYFPEPGGALRRERLTHTPFRIGRDASADLVIYCPRVSKAHAEIVLDEGDLCIRDLGSTNGTFVNGRRVQDRVTLTDGDILHLAEKEFRFGCDSEEWPNTIVDATQPAKLTGQRSLMQDSRYFRELLDGRQVTAYFQPIVTLADRQVVAYEALARGRHEALPESPGPLFALAEKLALAASLSRACRAVAAGESAGLPRPHALFLNIHPAELREASFLESLPGSLPADQPLVLEIPEDYAGDVRMLEQLRARLGDRNVRLAYDDFGVGQARLSALAQVPVDYVKLDRTIVQGLPHSSALRDLMRGLGQVCANLGTQVIAEGVETEEEAGVCLELGCPLGQGYLFARPMPAADLA
jgi:EAL domain-containing protein (putative c-di-GMP-specific phosphodiesterase class I)